jgi:hypothetical protein
MRGLGRALGIGWSLVAMVGCGAAPTRPGATGAEPVRARAGDVSIVAIPRPLGDVVALSLWLDAGTLDGAHGSASLLAAEIAALRAREARPDLEVAVVPDGTWFRSLCPRSELAICLDAWGRVVGTRTPTDAELEAAAVDLAARRARALARPERTSEALAVGAALGLSVRPLGEAEDPIDREEVAGFLDAHYGADRALVIAVGEVETDDLAALVSQHLTGPRASARRASRTPAPGSTTRHEEHADGEPTWSFAVRTSSEAEATGVVSGWRQRAHGWAALRTSAFPTRAGWVALATLRGDAERAVTVARWRSPATSAARLVSWPEDAWSLAERAGLAWTAEPAEARGRRAGMGVVGDVSEEDAAAVARALDEGPSASFVTRVVGGVDGLALVWPLEGPAYEAPHALGSTVLAATMLHERCAPEATLTVEPEQILLSWRGEVGRVLDAAAFGRDCLARGAPSDEDVDRARRAAMARAGVGDARREAAAALSFAATPGLVASSGSREALARLETSDVQARWRAWAARVGWSVVGASEALATVRASGLGLEVDALPALDAIAATTTPGTAGVAAVRRLQGLAGRELLLTVPLAGCDAQEIATEALAALALHARRAGAAPTWREAGCGPRSGAGWAAIALSGVPDDARAAELLALPSPSLAAALGRGAERADRRRALEGGDPLAIARALARGRPSDGPPRAMEPRAQWLEPEVTGRR